MNVAQHRLAIYRYTPIVTIRLGTIHRHSPVPPPPPRPRRSSPLPSPTQRRTKRPFGYFTPYHISHCTTNAGVPPLFPPYHLVCFIFCVYYVDLNHLCTSRITSLTITSHHTTPAHFVDRQSALTTVDDLAHFVRRAVDYEYMHFLRYEVESQTPLVHKQYGYRNGSYGDS